MAVLFRWGKTLSYTLFLIFRSSITTSITQSASLIFLISSSYVHGWINSIFFGINKGAGFNFFNDSLLFSTSDFFRSIRMEDIPAFAK